MKKHFILFIILLVSERFVAISQTISSLPFGCSLLVTHKFPINWETSNVEIGDTILRPHEKEFAEVDSCYGHLAFVKAFPLPLIKKFEHVKLGEEKNDCSCVDNLLLDSSRYRLPNLGSYECYYASDIISRNENFKKACNKNICIAYGNLILYDSVTHTAKIIQAYFSGGGAGYSSSRYFYIDKNKVLQIFDAGGTDAEFGLRNTYTIKVLQNGEVAVNKNK